MQLLARRILVYLAAAAILAWGSVAYADSITSPPRASNSGGSAGGGGKTDSAFSFTFSDGSGDAGFGTLSAISSGLGDGSLLVTGGTITVTSSAAGGAADGTYGLVRGGPSTTIGEMTFPCDVGGGGGTCVFRYDDLIYPTLDSSSSYLTMSGLLFGSATGPQTNFFANGGPHNYEFDYATPGHNVIDDTGVSFSLTASFIPEPSTGVLLGLALVVLTVTIVWMNAGRRRLAS